MKQSMKKSALSLAMATALLGTATWSTESQACAAEPLLSSVCVLAINYTDVRGFLPAQGQTMSIAQNSALFALLGVSFGGDGQSTFKLPDLRGRVIVGAGQPAAGGSPYLVGAVGGSRTLDVSQLPAHAHGLSGGTVSLTGLTGSVDGAGLTLKGTTAAAASGSPTGAGLATLAGLSKAYAAGAPNTAMVAGSISGAAPVTFAGAPTLGGNTTVVGSGAEAMPPYLALNYFIATQGIFPSRN